MGSPIVGFLKDNFGWSRKKGALAFGGIILLFGIPTVLFFSKGVFDEYDYWGGTIALVSYATAEIILFSWIVGIDKGWKLIHQGADMRIAGVFKFILKYITPTMLILILLASAVKPKDDDWSLLSLKGWELDKSSIIGELFHKDIGPNKTWFADEYYAEQASLVHRIVTTEKGNKLELLVGNSIKSYRLSGRQQLMVAEGDRVKAGEVLYKGKIINHKKQLDMFPGVVEKMLEIERLVKEDTYCSIQDYDYSTVKAIYDEIMPIIQSAFDEEKLYDLGY